LLKKNCTVTKQLLSNSRSLAKDDAYRFNYLTQGYYGEIPYRLCNKLNLLARILSIYVYLQRCEHT